MRERVVDGACGPLRRVRSHEDCPIVAQACARKVFFCEVSPDRFQSQGIFKMPLDCPLERTGAGSGVFGNRLVGCGCESNPGCFIVTVFWERRFSEQVHTLTS